MRGLAVRPLRRLGAPALASIAMFYVGLCGSAQAVPTLPSGFSDQSVVESIGYGTSVAFAPDGRMFFDSVGGLVRVRTPAGAISTVTTVSGAVYSIAVDKDFASNGYLYVLHQTSGSSGRHGRLQRLRVNPDNTLAGPPVTILGTATGDCQPSSNTDDCMRISGVQDHAVGTVVSDPVDGTLWVSNGDNSSPSGVDPLAYRAQDPNNLAGKLLHIDRDGRGLPGHAFCAGDDDLTHNCTKVHALGLRNTFRFALRPSDRLPIGGDVGWASREEVNIYRKGGNYGWPCYEGSLRTPGYSESNCAGLYAREGTSAGATAPTYEYAHDVGRAVIAGPVIDNPAWPAAYQGDILIGDYVAGWIKRLELDAADRVLAVRDFAPSGWADGVSLAFGRDGDLYYNVSGDADAGAIRRIHYSGGGNSAPTAVAGADTVAGALPLRVAFSSAGSVDSDGDGLTYEWDFGDGTPRQTGARVEHTYTTKGDFRATLRVSDDRGASDSVTLTIFAGNLPPTVTVTGPSVFRGGVPVTFDGTASDPDGAAIRPADMDWTVVLRHRDHDHPIQATKTASGVTFTPVVDHDADTHYSVTLRARDGGGAPASRTVELRPETRDVRISTLPAGAPVTYGDSVFPTPFSRPSTIGFRTTVSVPEAFTRDGTRYTFASWSDGGARQHDIVIPASDLSLIATYRDPEGRLAPGPNAPTPEGEPRTEARSAIRALSLSDRSVRPGQRMRVSFRLSRPARVQAVFQRRRGRDYVSVGALRHRGRTGVNTVRFRGRLNGRPLRRGHHRLVVRAVSATGRELGRRTVAFRVR